MRRLVNASYAALDREQWQLLVDVLDGDYDQRKLEEAQDALTRAAPLTWLEEADAADEARREMEATHGSGEAGQ